MAGKKIKKPVLVVAGTVDAVSTGLNTSRSDARRALVRYLRRLRS